MIEISFFNGMTLVLLGWLIFRLAAYSGTKTLNWKREAVQIFFLINLLVIVRMTFYPFATVNGKVQPLIFEAATVWPFRVNLVPFVNILEYDSRRDLLLNLIGNVAMFIPTGVMTPLIYQKWDGWKKTILFGFLLSLTIEIIQLPFAVRASDVDDLILNTLGVAMGYGILSLIRRAGKPG